MYKTARVHNIGVLPTFKQQETHQGMR